MHFMWEHNGVAQHKTADPCHEFDSHAQVLRKSISLLNLNVYRIQVRDDYGSWEMLTTSNVK